MEQTLSALQQRDSGLPAIPFELEALNQATEYQRWVTDTVMPYLGERILELGAGVGNLSRWLPVKERLILTETEPYLLDLLRKNATQSDKVEVRRLDLRVDRL